MKKNNIELSVKEASNLIGVTPRSVINYIKAKEINAVKVGKSWYIKEPSLMAFAKSYGFELDMATAEDQSFQEETKTLPPSKKTSDKKKKYIINTLKLYQIAHKVFSMQKWKDLVLKKNPNSLEVKLINNRLDIFELLGAGYYSFDNLAKKNAYSYSRQKVGAILALLYLDNELLKSWKDEITAMEKELLPAYSSLIRKIEKRSEK